MKVLNEKGKQSSAPQAPWKQWTCLLEVDGADMQLLHGSCFNWSTGQRISLATPQHPVLVDQRVFFLISKCVPLQAKMH